MSTNSSFILEPLWQQVVTAGILGSERQTLELPQAGASLDRLLSQLDRSDAEAALLGAAAAVSLYGRIGRLPLKDPDLALEPCDPEELPCCSPRAGQHLAMMLEGSYKEVLPQWLQAADAAGQRVPVEHLPSLLDSGRTQADLREAILPVLGKRGHWLAAHNPEWGYATPVKEDQASWETGTRAERASLLREIRKTDPERARELLISTWTREPANQRSSFLSSLEIGLSMADEPFLETCLDDRSKEVREAAANLLARLPESRLSRRMLDRVRPLLTWTPAKTAFLPGVSGKKGQLKVKLPESSDDAMKRDGIDLEPAFGIGEKAWRLVQMLGQAPPQTWSQEWEASPAEIVEAASGTEWESILLESWAAAAERYRDREWAEALLEPWKNLQEAPEDKARKKKEKAFARVNVNMLVGLLPEDRRDAFLLELLVGEECPLCKSQAVISVLQSTTLPWSVELARGVLEVFRRHRAHWKGEDWSLVYALKQFAYSIPPSLAEEAASGWPTEEKQGTQWNKVLEEFLSLLQFRQDVISEFQEGSHQ